MKGFYENTFVNKIVIAHSYHYSYKSRQEGIITECVIFLLGWTIHDVILVYFFVFFFAKGQS